MRKIPNVWLPQAHNSSTQTHMSHEKDKDCWGVSPISHYNRVGATQMWLYWYLLEQHMNKPRTCVPSGQRQRCCWIHVHFCGRSEEPSPMGKSHENFSLTQLVWTLAIASRLVADSQLRTISVPPLCSSTRRGLVVNVPVTGYCNIWCHLDNGQVSRKHHWLSLIPECPHTGSPVQSCNAQWQATFMGSAYSS